MEGTFWSARPFAGTISPAWRYIITVYRGQARFDRLAEAILTNLGRVDQIALPV